MSWPLSQDYNEAIQNPRSSFADAELRDGQVTVNALGLPLPRSGNFADVYEFHCPKHDSRWAIKCFTRKVAGLRERYSEISRCLKDAKLPFTVAFQYLEEGIRIRGQFYPLLKMRWVQGFLLNEFVRDNLDKPALIQSLGLIWQRMARRLREADIAHADLQHGNVLLVPGATSQSLGVRLIDYDGMFVPSLSGGKSGEVGHPNYQHPQRLREGTYNGEVDRVPLLVVATALRALSVGGRELWERHDNGDNLLFKESDLRAPAESELFRELLEMSNPLVKKLTGRLAEACELRLEDAPLLEELLPAEKPAAKAAARSSTAITATPPVEEFEEMPNWDFGQDEDEPVKERPKRRKRGKQEKGKVPMWAWAAGGAAVLLVACIGIGVSLGSRNGNDNTNGPAVVQNQNKPPSKDSARTTDKQPPKERQKPPPTRDRRKPPNSGGKPGGLIAVGDEQRRLLGHVGPVHAVAFSPDGRLALSGGEDKTVRLWDVATGQKVHKISDLDGPVQSVAFSPDGSRFYASTGSKGLREWDTATRTEIDRPQRDGLRLSPDGVFAATREETDGQPSLYLWQLATGKERLHLPLLDSGDDFVVGFSPGGQWLVVSGRRTLTQCNMLLAKAKRTPISVEHCLSVACSPNGSLTVLGAADGPARVFDRTTHKIVRQLEWVGQGPFHSLAFLPDGRRFLSGEKGLIRAWDVQTGKQLIAFSAHSGPVIALAVARDGLHALSAGHDGTVRLWDLTKVPPPAGSAAPPPTLVSASTLRNHNWGFGIALSPDGRHLLSADLTRTVTIRNLATGQVDYTLKATGLQVGRIALLADGRQLLYVDKNNVLQLLDCATETVVRRLGPTHANVRFVAVSPDGQRALTGGGRQFLKDGKLACDDCDLSLWDVREGKLLSTWKGHTAVVLAGRFSPDGRVVSCGFDGIRVWEGAEGKPIKHLVIPQAFNACVSADCRLVATGSGPTIRVWDVETGKQTQLPDRKGNVHCLAFAGSDRLLSGGASAPAEASGEKECVVRLWDVKTRQELRTFKGHQHEVMEVAATPDGRRAVSSGTDNTARIWDLGGASVPPEKPTGGEPAGAAVLRLGRAGCSGLALFPDGRRLLTWDGVQALTTWDLTTRQQKGVVNTLPGTYGRRLAFTGEGQQVLCVTQDQVLKQADLATGAVLRQFGPTIGRPVFLSVSPDGRLALTGGGDVSAKDGKVEFTNNELYLWDVKEGKRLAAWPGHTRSLLEGRFSPDGKRVVSCGQDGIRLWEVAGGKMLKHIPVPGPSVACVSADCRLVAATSIGRGTSVWDVEAGTELKQFRRRKGQVMCLAFTPGGERLLAGSVGYLPREPGNPRLTPDPEQCVVRLWDLKTGQELRTFKGHADLVGCVVVTADGRRAISGSTDRTVRLWDLPDAKAAPPDDPVAAPRVREVQHFVGTGPFRDVALTRDDKVLASTTIGWVWDASTGRGITSVNGVGKTQKIVLAPDGSRFALLASDRRATVWEVTPLKVAGTVRLPDQPVWDLVFTPDGEGLVSCGDDDIIRLWSLRPSKLLGSCKGHKGGVRSLAVSRDGAVLVSGGLKDGRVRVWDTKTARRRKDFPGHKGAVLSVGLSRDGKQFFSAGEDGTLLVRSFQTGKPIRRMTFPSLLACAWSPNGTWALVALPKGMVALCDLKTGTEICRFQAHDTSVSSVSFSRDGRQALTGGDREVRLWELPKEALPAPGKRKP